MKETAQKALEDWTTENQVIDTKIMTGILSRLSEKDKGLLLDVNIDVWEQRVLVTGTLDDPHMKNDVLALVNADNRITTTYDEIQLVTKAEKESRRQQAQDQKDQNKEGIGQTIDDFWISTKIEAQLLATKGITSVNYRWRSVRNRIYIIGRTPDRTELGKVMDVINGTKGVESVKHFIQIKSWRLPSTFKEKTLIKAFFSFLSFSTHFEFNILAALSIYS